MIAQSLSWQKGLPFKQYSPPRTAEFRIKFYALCQSNRWHVWSYIIYTGQGMELTPQFVNSNTNKTAENSDQTCWTSAGSQSHTLDEQTLYFSRDYWNQNRLWWQPTCQHKNCSFLGESQETGLVNTEETKEFCPSMRIRPWQQYDDTTISIHHTDEMRVCRQRQGNHGLLLSHFNFQVTEVVLKDQILESTYWNRSKFSSGMKSYSRGYSVLPFVIHMCPIHIWHTTNEVRLYNSLTWNCSDRSFNLLNTDWSCQCKIFNSKINGSSKYCHRLQYTGGSKFFC